MKSYSKDIVTPEKTEEDTNKIITKLTDGNEHLHDLLHTVITIIGCSLVLHVAELGLLAFCIYKLVMV